MKSTEELFADLIAQLETERQVAHNKMLMIIASEISFIAGRVRGARNRYTRIKNIRKKIVEGSLGYIMMPDGQIRAATEADAVKAVRKEIDTRPGSNIAKPEGDETI